MRGAASATGVSAVSPSIVRARAMSAENDAHASNSERPRRGVQLGEDAEVVGGENIALRLVEDDAAGGGLAAQLLVGAADEDVVEAAIRLVGQSGEFVATAGEGVAGCAAGEPVGAVGEGDAAVAEGGAPADVPRRAEGHLVAERGADLGGLVLEGRLVVEHLLQTDQIGGEGGDAAADEGEALVPRPLPVPDVEGEDAQGLHRENV